LSLGFGKHPSPLVHQVAFVLSHRNDEEWKRIALLRFWQLPGSRRKRKRRWAERDLEGGLELVVYSWGKQKKIKMKGCGDL
jgi:hypothetical protein